MVKKLYSCEQSTNPLQPTEANPPSNTTANPTNSESFTTSGIPLQPPGRNFIISKQSFVHNYR